jgi:hypothetical protein
MLNELIFSINATGSSPFAAVAASAATLASS